MTDNFTDSGTCWTCTHTLDQHDLSGEPPIEPRQQDTVDHRVEFIAVGSELLLATFQFLLELVGGPLHDVIRILRQ